MCEPGKSLFWGCLYRGVAGAGELFREGSEAKVKIVKGEKVLLELPLFLGLAGLAALLSRREAALLAALALLALAGGGASRCEPEL